MDEEPIIKAFTPQEKRFIWEVTAVMPKGFISTVPPGPARDIRVLGMGALALSDYNHFPPFEGLTFNNIPILTVPVIVLGTVFYTNTFKQMEFTLVDVQYSDMGLSISLDRVGKIGTALQNMEKLWLRQLENTKKCVIMDVASQAPGLGTPRFQSNLSRFISILGGGAFGWNIP